MASTCPNCGKKLHFWNIKAECSACGVSIPNFDWEARLEEDNRNAEKAFGVFNRTLSRMAYSMWGTKLRIARLVLTFLPAVGFILPWSNIKGTGSSFVLSILAFDGSKSLIDFFKAFFGDVGLFTTTMGMEGYGGPVTLGVIGYFLFLLSALFIVIAFFMVLIRCKNSKTKTTIVFDVLSRRRNLLYRWRSAGRGSGRIQLWRQRGTGTQRFHRLGLLCGTAFAAGCHRHEHCQAGRGKVE